MNVSIIYKLDSMDHDAGEIRTILCQEAMASRSHGYNPLVETKLNHHLEKIAQRCFEDGRRFQAENPKLKP